MERLLDAIERTPDSAALADRLRGREAVIGRLGRDIEEPRVELSEPSWDPIQVEELRGALVAALEAQTEEARENVQRVAVEIEVDDGGAWRSTRSRSGAQGARGGESFFGRTPPPERTGASVSGVFQTAITRPPTHGCSPALGPPG